ncbi:FecR family protein [Herbaspirillum seropedicae]|uniref:FecR family protein n=1 Tax=Herbaspirillum seropedicae TaxID=964 RepID=UPI003FCDAFC4
MREPTAQPGPSSEDLTAMAADWIVRLSAGDAAQQQETAAAFARWQGQSRQHAQAARELQGVLAHCEGLLHSAQGDPSPLLAGLEAAMAPSQQPGRGRRAVAALALACCIGLPLWLGLQAYPARYLLSDMRTATGYWDARTLADGSRLLLSGSSAANFHFDAQRRTVELVQGELLVEVARDPARPFVIQTADGSIRALGTRFLVRRDQAGTLVSMLESKVSIQPGADTTQAPLVLEAGQRVRLHGGAAGPLEHIDAAALERAWRRHQLVSNARPLTEVLDELNRHRPGRILYDQAQLAGLHMTVVLPLDDTQRALQLLVDGVPGLRVRQFTPYLTYIDLAPAP